MASHPAHHPSRGGRVCACVATLFLSAAVPAGADLIDGRVATTGSDLPTLATADVPRFSSMAATDDGPSTVRTLFADPITPASLAGTSVEWDFHGEVPSGPSVAMGAGLPELSVTQSAAAEPAKFAALGGAAATLLRRHRRRLC